MQDRPSVTELISSVRDFLENEVVPAAGDVRLRFRSRVAANVLSVVQREMEMEDRQLRQEFRRLTGIYKEEDATIPERLVDLRARVDQLEGRLTGEIRSGLKKVLPRDPVWGHIRATVVEKLRIANPKYLKRIGMD